MWDRWYTEGPQVKILVTEALAGTNFSMRFPSELKSFSKSTLLG
jgi:hypothetical protein